MKLSLFTAILLFFSCSIKPKELKKLRFSEAFQLKKSIKIPDSLGLKGAFPSSTTLGDSLLYFSSYFANGIFELNRDTEKIRKIGRDGIGPGEYNIPMGIDVSESEIAFTQAMDLGITILTLDGNFLRSIKKENYIQGNTIRKVDTLFYSLNPASSPFLLHCSNGKNFHAGKKHLRNVNGASTRSILLDKGKLYFCNSIEDSIYVLNTKSFKESAIKISGVSNFYDWAQTKHKPLERKLAGEIQEKHRTIYEVFLYESEALSFFVLSSSRSLESKNSKPLVPLDLHFLNKRGEAILQIECDAEKDVVINISNGTIIARRVDSTGDLFIEFLELSERAKAILNKGRII